MSVLQLQSAFGLGLLCLLAWICGGCRRGVRRRVVIAGLGGQFAIAALLLHVPPIRAAVGVIGDAVDALARATKAGTTLVFGYLGGGPPPFAEVKPEAGFILFFQALPLVLVVGALAALLYHWRILPLLVRGIAAVLGRLFGLSGACNVSVAANVFVGMVEAPLLIKPWLPALTRSEIFVCMVAGLATISGNMLVVYAMMIAPVVPDAAGQLLTASLVAAPSGILAALLMLPESEGAEGRGADGPAPRLYDSSIDAILRGTSEGLQLLLGIMAALIVFVALVELLNIILQPLTGQSLQGLLAWLFWPLAWAMGVPAAECPTVGRSLGIKVAINEFVSYLDLAGGGGAGLSPRSRVILTFALCGFTNFASLGIMVTGLGAMVPGRRAEIVGLGLRSLLAATIACCMTGAVIGVLTPP